MFINPPILPLRHSVVWGEAKEKRHAGMIIAGDGRRDRLVHQKRQLPGVCCLWPYLGLCDSDMPGISTAFQATMNPLRLLKRGICSFLPANGDQAAV